jgi:tetratricopeptide (TPR) repeat protein
MKFKRSLTKVFILIAAVFLPILTGCDREETSNNRNSDQVQTPSTPPPSTITDANSIAQSRWKERRAMEWERAVQKHPDDPNVWVSWGDALIEQAQNKSGSQADTLFTEAYAKYKRAVAIDPNDFFEWYYYWGKALMKQARQKEGAQREELLQQAEEKLMQAEKELLLWQAEKDKEYGAYTLACIYALRGNEAECKRWLQVGEEAGTLFSSRKTAMEEEAFASMREKEWFKKIRWNGE